MNHERQMGPLGTLILGVVFIVVGCFVGFVFGKPILDNAKASSEWPTAKGVVVESEVTTHRSDGSTMYTANVLYEYKVDSKKYKADTVSFGGSYSSNSSSAHHEIVNRYPKNKKVEVFYDPDQVALFPHRGQLGLFAEDGFGRIPFKVGHGGFVENEGFCGIGGKVC